jgi:hypothetical protein
MLNPAMRCASLLAGNRRERNTEIHIKTTNAPTNRDSKCTIQHVESDKTMILPAGPSAATNRPDNANASVPSLFREPFAELARPVLLPQFGGRFLLRAARVRKDAYDCMGLRTAGMEFGTEMVVKATLLKMQVTEVPTTLSPDGRSRRPHLRTWRDGWRTLRFFLLYSPRRLFLYPGMALMMVGALLGLWLLPTQRTVGSVTFDVHTLLYAAVFVLLGFQALRTYVLEAPVR